MQHYRREIDGLRALAVTAVMIYHAGVPGFSGGFIGVDVFFVISGFLITGILVRQYDNGTLNLSGFWARRAKRILPSLTVVLMFSGLAGWFILPPPALQRFGESLIAASVFSSNIYFWHNTASYFDPTVKHDFLIHLWSLAVEEQYYIFYPWILVFIIKYAKKYLFGILFVAAIASLGLCIYMSGAAPKANFYLLPPRAWELLLGALALPVRNRFRSAPIADILAFLGVGLIVAPVFIYDDLTVFPGWTAVPPVVGTALAIAFARPDRGIGRILASTPFVAIGLISYSAYLWHQPLLAIGAVYSYDSLGWKINLVLIFVSIILAWGTYRLIERPFIEYKSGSNAKVLLTALCAQFVVGAAGFALWKSGGAPSRLPENIARLSRESEAGQAQMNALFLTSPAQVATPPIIGDTGPIDLAILGDSHGAALATGLDSILRGHARRAAVFVSGGVMPGMTQEQAALRQRDGVASLATATDQILKTPSIKTVVLAARWTLYFNGTSQYRDDGGLKFSVSNKSNELKRQESLQDALHILIQKLALAHKNIILVYPIPELPYNLPDYVSGTYLRSSVIPESRVETFSHYKSISSKTRQRITEAAQGIPVTQYDPSEYLCDQKNCLTMKDNLLLYNDDNHLSQRGAEIALSALPLK